MRRTLFVLLLTSSTSALAADAPKLELKDGDRIVYLGNAFAERDANYGYFETLLTIRHPDISFTFRNLGWSGDTVWGDARARFGTRADGFQHLKEHVFAFKPTVILVAYGMNESFAGEAGLPEFEKGLNTLLDTLAETTARIVLISPIPHENMGPPLPDPARHNSDLIRYQEAISKAAAERKLTVLDPVLYSKGLNQEFYKLTDDGLHPTQRGYSLVAVSFGQKLGIRHVFRGFSVEDDRKILEEQNWEITNLRTRRDRVTFDAKGQYLPEFVLPRRDPSDAEGAGLVAIVRGIPEGAYSIRIDERPVHFLQMKPRANGTWFRVLSGPEIDQVEKLRAAINRKNELYFHRWRPQNETYLFGFRKHEQGNNAEEIPLFDPLVAEQEAEISRLKKPVTHTYELIREGDGK